MLEEKSKNSKKEDGVFIHILLLNCEAQKLTIIYYSKKTNEEYFKHLKLEGVLHQNNLLNLTLKTKYIAEN
jgi:hypothetical protein